MKIIVMPKRITQMPVEVLKRQAADPEFGLEPYKSQAVSKDSDVNACFGVARSTAAS